MELLQHIIDEVFSIKADGTDAANPGVYRNYTDSIGAWVEHGYPLCDGKVVKAEVNRIVNLQTGENIDQKFGNLPNDDIKRYAGKEILFDLKSTTLISSIFDPSEYEAARLYRQQVSAVARANRWDYMLIALSDPSVLINAGKIAILDEELRKYKNDYLISDNKIFESFINGTDHSLDSVTAHPRSGKLKFATDTTLSLNGLSLWDDVNLGGPDAAYKTLVTDIIKNSIINATQYIL